MASHHHHHHTHHPAHAQRIAGGASAGDASDSGSAGGGSAVAQRASVPVVTDVTSASPEELEEALHYYGLDALHYKLERTSGGVNNAVYYARPNPGVKAEPVVVRIYRNGNNIARVLYEHAVLHALKAKAAMLPFEVPTPHPTKKTSRSMHDHPAMRGVDAHFFSTFHVMKSGTAAAVFKLVPGGPAPLSAAHNIGIATAHLVRALEDVIIPPVIKSVNPLYRNLYEAHHRITRKLFFERVQSAEFDNVRVHMDSLLARFHDAEALIGVIHQGGGLKEQVINADLHFDNVLCEGDQVTGLLDFEFAARDWRVMELVVGLSKTHIGEYITGYALGGGTLTAREAQLVPQLIILRILNNIVYFVGRAVCGEDTIEPIVGRAAIYAKRCTWLVDHNDAIVKLLVSQEGLVRD